MVVPVLPHEVKARWCYFTFSRTQLPVLCVYVEDATCQDNDLECSGRAHDLWLGFRPQFRDERTVIFAIQIQSRIFKTQSKSNHSPKQFKIFEIQVQIESKILTKYNFLMKKITPFISINSVQIRS